MRITVLLVAVGLFGLAGCQRVAELESENKALVQEKIHLQHEIQDRERRIVDTFSALNEIYASVAKIDDDLVTLIPLEAGDEGQRAAVTEATWRHLENIRAALEEKQARIEDLVKKNEKAGVRIASLNKQIRKLAAELQAKQERIVHLEAQILGLVDAVSAQGVTIATQRDELMLQQQALRDGEERLGRLKEEMERVWYVAGDEETLEASLVIREEGGFLFGWGATHVLSHPVDQAAYLPASVSLGDLRVSGSVARLIPARGENTYKILRDANGSRILISDPEAFWQDRYLAIVTK